MNKGVNREGAHECGVISHTCRSWVGKGTINQLGLFRWGWFVVLDKAVSRLDSAGLGQGQW